MNATRGCAQWAHPLFSLLLTMHTGEGNAPPAPPPLTRWGRLEAAASPIAAGHPRALRRPGGRRKARRRTIPRRRSAAPSGQGEQPFVKCGIAEKPARRSLPRLAQTGSGFPSGRCSRCRSAARARTTAAMHSAAAPASAPGAATPSEFRQPRRWHWLPRHPAPARSPPQQRAGRFRLAAPVARPPCWPGAHSLSGPRRCPRSMTPGTAAAPAPGCWLRCLRSMRSGTAAARLLQPEAA